MKAVFSNVILFAVLVLVFSAMSACTDTAGSSNDSAAAPPPDAPAGNAPAGNGVTSTKNSGYPPIASAVATAEIKTLDGAVFTVNDKKGKVLLLNLWATWCGPCRSEMPALVRMQNKHADQGFQVIGLNTDDEDVQQINDFSAEMKLNYQIAYADTKLQSSLLKISKFPGIPQSFLIDRDGHLRGVFRGANPADVAKMEDVVAKLVNEDPNADGQPAAVSEPIDNPASASTPNADPIRPEKVRPDGKDTKSPK